MDDLTSKNGTEGLVEVTISEFMATIGRFCLVRGKLHLVGSYLFS